MNNRRKNIVYDKKDIQKLKQQPTSDKSEQNVTDADKTEPRKSQRKKRDRETIKRAGTHSEDVVIEEAPQQEVIVVDLFEAPADKEDNDQYAVFLATSQCQPIKTLFETLNGILGNINIHFTPEKAYITTHNRDENITVNVELWRERLEYYVCKKQEYIVGIKLANFYKIISTLGANNILTIYVDTSTKERAERLGVRIKVNDRATTHDYTINRINAKVKRLSAIKPDAYPVIISMPSNYFQKICRDAHRLVDKVEISYSGNKQLFLRFAAENVTQETSIEENKDYLKFVKNEKTDEMIIQGVYSLKDLVSFSKCTSISDTVLLHLDIELPLMIQYSVGNLGIIQLFMDEAIKGCVQPS